MRKGLQVPVIILSGVLILTGCSTPHYLYWPNSQLVPLYSEPKKLIVAPAFSTSFVNSCFELQAGYSFPGHIAVMTGFMAGGNNNSGQTYNDYCRLKYLEAAIGYYRSWADIFVFEVYGGYGGGTQKHAMTYTDWYNWQLQFHPDGTLEFSTSKLFLQADLGLKWKWIGGSFSFRFSRLNFNELIYEGVSYNLPKIHAIEGNRHPVCFEPALSLFIGPDPIKFNLQLVLSKPLGTPEIDRTSSFEMARIMMGVVINIPTGRVKTEQNR